MRQPARTLKPRNVSTKMAYAFLLLVTALGMSACGTENPAPQRIPKAVFIIVDGIPADVVERTATPNLDAISSVGGYTRAHVGGAIGEETESPTVSAVGYMSLITGTWSNKHNVRDNQVNDPDYRYWDIFRIAKSHDPALQTAIFSTWTDNRTKLLGDGKESAGGKKLDYAFDGFELDTDRFPHDEDGNYILDIDALVVDEAARYIGASGPDLSWVYLEHTDSIGHRYGDSQEQTDAVVHMDAQVGAIWASIQARQENHDEDWLLVVTTDHGRDAETGRDHGGQSERERTTWIVTNSDRLNANFKDLPAVVDILPSIATHLHLGIPGEIRDQLEGQSFID